jgi:hypothetical protein
MREGKWRWIKKAATGGERQMRQGLAGEEVRFLSTLSALPPAAKRMDFFAPVTTSSPKRHWRAGFGCLNGHHDERRRNGSMEKHATTLDELLSDPMVKLVMASDGVRPQEIRILFEQARKRRGEPMVPPRMIRRECRQGYFCA